MAIEKLTWNTFAKNKSVIVIGGGPSINERIVLAQHYSKTNNSLVLSANYPHNISIDYTIFIDDNIFRKMYLNNAINSKGLVLGKKIVRGRSFNNNKKQYEKMFDRIVVINDADKPKTWETNKVFISKNGFINHITANTGFASILISVFFEPEEILLCGFDGPQNNTYYHCDNNIPKKYDSVRFNQRKRYLGIILRYLMNKKISVKIFKGDRLWGINKSEFNIIEEPID